MQYSELVSSLNERQLEAVEANSQYTRVIAGAGSGKETAHHSLYDRPL